MDAQSLNAFVCVATTGSFSTAGERLFLTQPAVSKRIANLEALLGQRLFDRIGRQVSLTEAGAQLLPRARSILQEIDDTRRQLSNLSGTVGGRLSLATSHHISLHRLPRVLKRFSREYPEVELDLEFAESEVAYDRVLQGQLELAVITLSPDPHPQIASTPIWTDRLRYSVAQDHPLTQRSQVRLQDLTDYNAILPGRATFTRQIVEQSFRAQNLDLRVVMSTNYLDTIRMMVSIGLGWSLLPETLIDASLKVLPASPEDIIRPLGLIVHKERTLSNAARAFIQLLESAGDSENKF
ncbi:LysR family transcriptional regulator [Motiliproteus sp. SC1-56]|uniref:LysR family transcriptional regulator n=1 Tax=Motiliproteus sp. SC1-56 TaxID=2799565 RepID=UPI001A8D6D8C|nr:LysR family transcriptional regulator [Motiliproteus sp. SC1-56]